MAVPVTPVSPGLNAPPSGGASGDLYVARVYGFKSGSGAWTSAAFTDAAWTSLGATNTVAGSSVGSHLFWLIRGASEPSFAITANGADAGTGYECFRVTGHDAVTPIADTDAVNGNSSGSPLTLNPSVTVPTDGLVLMFGVNWTADSWEDPAGYTARGSASGEVETWSKSDAGGTTQSPSVTNGNNTDAGAVHMVAIASASSGAPVLESSTPANAATGVSPTANLQLDFDIAVQAATGNVHIEQLGTPVSPAIPTVNTDAQNSNATTFVVDVPAVSTPAAGSSTIVVIGLTKDANSVWTGTWPPTGWTVGVATGQTSVYHAIIWQRYTASASATTFSLTQSSDNASSRAWVVTGAHLTANPEFGTPATASSTAPNPPSLTPSWGSEPSASGYYVSIDGNITSYTHPTGWTANAGNNTTTDATTTNRVGQAYSHNVSTTGAQDPGALTTTTGRWIATTWSVRPADPTVILETIPIGDTGRITFASDLVTINPTADLPASQSIQIRIDSTAIEAVGGGPDWAGFSAGQWTFTTGAGGGGSFSPVPRTAHQRIARNMYPRRKAA